MNKETLRMQMLAGVITEGQYKAKLEEIETKEKESLNEHFIAGGIVGIGAINQIPSRAKADYEDAFEYFLSQKYPLNEEESVEEDLNEADAIAIKAIDDKIQNDPEFLKKTKEAMAKAEKGDTTDLASLMVDFGKMFEADELEEGKEIEETKVEILPTEIQNSKEFKNLVALLKRKPDEAEDLAAEFKKLDEEYKYYDYSGDKKVEITKKDYIINKLKNAGFWAALSAVSGYALGSMSADDVLQAALTMAGFAVPIGTALSSTTGREKVKEESGDENALAAGNEVEHPEGMGTIELVTDYASHADEIDDDLGMDWESETPKEELTWYKIKGDDGKTYWFDEEELSAFN